MRLSSALLVSCLLESTLAFRVAGIAMPLSTRRAAVSMADDDGPTSFSDAFASFAKKEKPLKPGQGGAKRDDVKGLPIRLGGTTRDGSLGSLRAAAKNWQVLRDPRNWESEEFGLIGVIAITVLSIWYGYVTYVSPSAPALRYGDAGYVSPAQIVRTNKLASCAGDATCEQQVMQETQAKLDKQMDLDRCLNDAFGGTEKRMCQQKFGGKSVLGYF